MLNRGSLRYNPINLAPFTLAAFVYLAITFGDALMAYTVPQFLSIQIKNSLIVGFIFSLSSVSGVVFDFIAGEKLHNRSYWFFLRVTFLTTLLFPLSFLIHPHNIVFFTFGLVVWGIYYEAIAFANYDFVKRFSVREYYTASWSILNTINALAYVVGPLLASFLIGRSLQLPLFGAYIFYIPAIFLGIHMHNRFKNRRPEPQMNTLHSTRARTELKKWRLIISKIWPIWILGLFMWVTQSFIYTVGIVHAESLRSESPYASLIISMNAIPTLILGLFMGRMKFKDGKKRVSILFALGAGLSLSMYGLTDTALQAVAVIGLFSFLYSISWNFLSAVYEDYAARSDLIAKDIEGVERSTSGIAYIIGPILAGALATIWSEKVAISIAGVLLVGTTLISMYFTPVKIRLPLKELKEA